MREIRRSAARCSVLAIAACVALLLAPSTAAADELQPVYVGVRICTFCHEGPGMGNQYSLWLLTKHSRAYASLATPEAKEMAKLSGVTEEPQEAQVCLGCHATGSEEEGGERDPGFRIEDGVQCEMCHGPGSEYIAENVMRDHDAAVKAGLRTMKVRDCERCHYVKGSHVAVHHKPKLDLEKAYKDLAHPTPETFHLYTLARAPANSSQGDRPSYTGVRGCAACHKGPDSGYQFSRWRLSAHARAYAVLATPAADALAREAGIEGDPRKAQACLGCHATGQSGDGEGFLPTFSVKEGVGCESCHGAGSQHAEQANTMDPRDATASGLKPVGRHTCRSCHESAHGKPFDFKEASRMIAHPTEIAATEDGPRYKTPLNLALTPDGREVWVACEASDSVIVVDAGKLRKVAEITVGGQPHDVAFSPDGRLAYVSNRLDDSVSIVDVAARRVLETFLVGDDPHGLLTDPSGERLFILNTLEGSISIFDTASRREIKRLSASRNPWSLSLSPDGSRILITNTLPRFGEFRTPSMSEVTVLDVENGVVENRAVVPDTNLLQGVSWHPSGEFAFITLNRTKNLVPMTRILQGWTITNGLGIVWRDGRVDQVLLDEPNLYFPDVADVAFTPGGDRALVTSSGSDRVAVIDVPKLLGILERATDEERARVLPNHLGQSIEFVIKHIPTRNSPRGVVVSGDGARAFVANALDDSLTVIDLRSLEAVERVDLGGPEVITEVRRGERLFHSASISFQRQFSCHSCHPDGHVDGLTYDIEPDGIGVDPVDNRTLRGILDTDPFKWTGINPTLSRQCGPRLAVFFTRTAPFTPDELEALVHYIATIPRPPNRHRPFGADLTEAQRRGKKMFERTRTNDGRVIPPDGRCVTCHMPPLFTDRSQRDVGTKQWLDGKSKFDVPHLNNIYGTAPYLHDGIAATLEEIWTRYNPYDRHGVTNDMTKDQLNDLIEYLKTF